MKWRYSARDMSGKQVRGTVEAISLATAVEALRQQNLIPINFSEVKTTASLPGVSLILGRVSGNDLANFTRQLSTMISAGLPLTDALNLLRVQSPPALAPIVAQILADVQGGVALSSAMAKHPKVFSKVYLALVKAGEAAGVMEKILNRLADNEEKSRAFRSKVTSAMIYPVIILIGMVGVFVLMMVVVIPKLTALYADFDAELPLATKIIMAMSDISIKYGWAIVIVLLLGAWAMKSYLKSETGRYKYDSLFYKVPIMGLLARQVMLTELTRTLSLLVGAGVSVVEGLNIVAGAVGNVVVEKDVRRIAKQVEKGFPVSISFSESESFPAIVGQMIAVGEETGKLDEVLAKVSGYFETESDEKVKGLTAAIEPIILIILAVGVGFLMYAIIMPIYDLTNQI